MSEDEVRDYADDPADLRPGLPDRLFVGLEPLTFLYMLLSPCVLFAPVFVVGSLWGVLACRVPAARRNAWLLLIISLVLTLFLTGLVLASRQVA